MGSRSVRNSSVELLRFFFMFMIVIGHAYVHGTHVDYPFIYSWAMEWSTAPHLSLFALSKAGVTGFMFISGYYGIKMNKTKWINLFLVAFFYYVILMRFHGWQGMLHPYDFWWYLSAYVVICLISPFVEIGFQSLGESKIRYIVLGLLFYNYVGRWIGKENSHDMVFLLSIYLFARYLKVFSFNAMPEKLRSIWRVVNDNLVVYTLFVAICIMVLPVMAVRLGFSDATISLIVSNNNIILLLFAMLVVKCGETHCTQVKAINWLASSVLSIYLITDFPTVRPQINSFLFPYMMEWIGIPIALGVCLGCVMADKIRECIFFIVYRIFGKIIDKFGAPKG